MTGLLTGPDAELRAIQNVRTIQISEKIKL